MQDKVYVLARCRLCGGQAHLPTSEVLTTPEGTPYFRHVPCTRCQGTGMEGRWLRLHEFVRMLLAVEPEEQNA